MVFVNRESVSLLDDSWAVLGLYFLLGPSDNDPDRYVAYVGKVGKRTLLLRVKEQVAAKSWWRRALIITSPELNSAEIGWLEGRLYDVLNNAVAAEVKNRGRPGDDSLDVQERAMLEGYVEPIMAALRACGASPDTADQKPPAPIVQKKTVYKESGAAPLRKAIDRTTQSLPAVNQVNNHWALSHRSLQDLWSQTRICSRNFQIPKSPEFHGNGSGCRSARRDAFDEGDNGD